MADCVQMKIKEITEEQTQHNSWIFILRQSAVGLAICTSFFQLGLCMGTPPVVIAQLRRENVTVSDDQASWFSASYHTASLPWVLVIPLVSYHCGPRLTIALVTTSTIIANTLFTFSSSLNHIFISSAIQGIHFASEITVAISVIAEYSSAVYRGVFETLKCASIHWGLWVGNALGTFCQWRTIGMLGIGCGLFNLLLVFTWPESPWWLAANGRYEQCRKSHRWLKGTTSKEEVELERLINSYKNSSNLNEETNMSKLRIVLRDMSSKVFYKPVLLSCLTLFVIQMTGKFIIAVYALDILKKITGGESSAYKGMLILDGVSVLSMYIGSGFSRYVNRRTMFFGLGGIGLIFLCIFSLYLYLVKLAIIRENTYLSITILSIYMLSVGCGPLLLASTIYGDLIPLKRRIHGMTIVGFFFGGVTGAVLKLFPLVFKTFGLHGGFLTLAISAFIPCVILYKYLPETKSKTLTEIESFFKETNSKNEENQVTDLLVPPVQTKSS